MSGMPIYCPLLFEYDRQRVAAELLKYENQFERILVSERPILPEHRREFFMVADDDHYDNVERSRNGTYVPGTYRSLEGIHLTHLPTAAGPGYQSTQRRVADDCSGWEWDPRWDVPYTRETIERLPFTRLRGIRVLSLPPSGFLPVHRDAFDQSYWEGGHATISLLAASGGQQMHFWIDGEVHQTACPAFFFKDCSPHGVPVVQSRRILVRVSGLADQDRLRAMSDWNGALPKGFSGPISPSR
jgi:hypothetical protein